MKASEAAKKHGLKNLSEVAKLTGKSLQTLINWQNNNPRLFEIVVLGSKKKKELEDYAKAQKTTLL